MEFLEKLKAARVVPVIVIKELGQTVPLAKALVAGASTSWKLRCARAGLDATKAIAAQLPHAVVGHGSDG